MNRFKTAQHRIATMNPEQRAAMRRMLVLGVAGYWVRVTIMGSEMYFALDNLSTCATVAELVAVSVTRDADGNARCPVQAIEFDDVPAYAHDVSHTCWASYQPASTEPAEVYA